MLRGAYNRSCLSCQLVRMLCTDERVPDEAGPLAGPFLAAPVRSTSFLLPFLSSDRVLGRFLASPASLRPAAASSEAEPDPFGLGPPAGFLKLATVMF